MKIGIIGYGNMGSCLAEKLKSKYEIFVFDKDKNKINNLSRIKLADSNLDLVKKVEVLILAIKPQDFDNVLDEIKNDVKEKLVISIAAGITTKFIEKYLGNVRIIRVMPNMPLRIALAMSCLSKNELATVEDLAFAKQLFDNLGRTLILDEDMMDAATAISGSGPGYVYDLMENGKLDIDNPTEIKKFSEDLTRSAESINFSHQDAVMLAETTVFGSIELLKASNFAAAELKKQIASKGGTTEAGLEILHKGGSLKEAVKAARDRAKELSKK